MRVPLSWLRVVVPELTAPAHEVAAALVRAGLEVEQVHRYGADVSNVVVGQVLEIEELTGHKKPIRFCRVDVGSRVHDVVCGATNFVVGDRVPFALPGAVLPGGFAIATRQTYGRTSDGMICSEAELAISEASSGILVLDPGSPLGADVVDLLALRDDVLDIAVTPDRGYTLSIRGVGREVATALDLPFLDPAAGDGPPAGPGGYAVQLPDPGCDRYVAASVTGVDPASPSPFWLRRRLSLAGMRSISLVVDITNHVMLELGQPLHAFDLDAVQGPVVVRRAHPGEALVTLDGQTRQLRQDDLLITDDRGPIAFAGVMGGESTEITGATRRVLIESAHFEASTITRTARHHRLPSEASKRYERGVDPALCAVAAGRAAQLLAELGGGVLSAVTDVDQRAARSSVRLPVDLPTRVAGRVYPPEVVTRRLEQVGCATSGGDVLLVDPPSWRPDLTGPADLVEEVLRLEGYDTVPVALPSAPAGRGLSEQQRLRRTASRALAASGLVEVVTPPFVSDRVVEVLGLEALRPPRVLNPLSEQESLLRPSLLPGLLVALQRNVGRGLHDVAIFETGSVFRGTGEPVAEVPKTSTRPTDEQIAALDAALPMQPRLAGLVLAGRRGRSTAAVGDAVEVFLALAKALGVTLEVARSAEPPYHPGRSAALLLGTSPVAVVGELHPRVVAALGLPERCVAGELDLDLLVAAAAARGPAVAPTISPYPPSSVDVALVVGHDVLAADLGRSLQRGAGPLLEHVALFDVFEGPQIGEGRRSLAYSLRFRAPDRTLTDGEVLAARDAAVAQAGTDHGAVLRG